MTVHIGLKGSEKANKYQIQYSRNNICKGNEKKM